MQIFSLKTCDTCRKAIRELRTAGHDPDIVDVRADGVSPGDIARFLEVFGDELINKRSTTWRGLSEAERCTAPAQLLANHPTLMKRPVIDAGGQLYMGWKANVRDVLLG